MNSDFNPEFSSKFGMLFHPKENRKQKNYNPYIYFTAHTINCVCNSRQSVFRELEIYSFASRIDLQPDNEQ